MTHLNNPHLVPLKKSEEEFAKYVELLRNLHLDLRETSLKVILSLGQNFGQARRQIWNILYIQLLLRQLTC